MLDAVVIDRLHDTIPLLWHGLCLEREPLAQLTNFGSGILLSAVSTGFDMKSSGRRRRIRTSTS